MTGRATIMFTIKDYNKLIVSAIILECLSCLVFNVSFGAV